MASSSSSSSGDPWGRWEEVIQHPDGTEEHIMHGRAMASSSSSGEGEPARAQRYRPGEPCPVCGTELVWMRPHDKPLQVFCSMGCGFSALADDTEASGSSSGEGEPARAAQLARQLWRLIEQVEHGRKPYTPFQGYMPALRWAASCLEDHPDYHPHIEDNRLLPHRDYTPEERATWWNEQGARDGEQQQQR